MTAPMFGDAPAEPEPAVDVEGWDYEWAEERLGGGHVTTYHVEHAPPQAVTQHGSEAFIGLSPYHCAVCGHAIMDRVPPGEETIRPRPLVVDVDSDAVVAEVAKWSPRLLRIFEALAGLNCPPGWDARFHDGPFGVVLHRQSDGWVVTLMPSTDGTPRWYLNGLLGADGGMAESFEAAVASTIATAPVRVQG